jgi:hypothetical protein
MMMTRSQTSACVQISTFLSGCLQPALDVSFGWEPLAAFAAGLVEKSRCSRQFLLPDGFARHITEGEPLLSF